MPGTQRHEDPAQRHQAVTENGQELAGRELEAGTATSVTNHRTTNYARGAEQRGQASAGLEVGWRLHEGEATETLATITPGSLDAVVTDPPYGIHFMKREWDGFGSKDVEAARRFQAWTTYWAQRAALATKPGANWLVFGSPGTYHRLACGLEDAGVRIVNCLMWVYGEGLPKAPEVAPGVRLDVKPAYEPILLGRSPANGPLTEAHRRHGTAGINIDACRIAGTPGNGHWSGDDGSDATSRPGYEGGFTAGGRRGRGRWPSNLMLDDEAARRLDAESAELRSGGAPRRRQSAKHSGRVYEGRFHGQQTCGEGQKPSRGGPSQFFYCAKASRADRNRTRGTQTVDNDHPCVKPIDLMRWLVRLATPPEGRILDPFAGSGSTGVAALLEGRQFEGVEENTGYARLARLRLGATE